MMYFIITTSLVDNEETLKRQSQYMNGITQLKRITQSMGFTQYKIVVVENNGSRHTFFDELRITNDDTLDIFYTDNNYMGTLNKGTKELRDVLDIIANYNIIDDEFIVKISGRCVLCENSEFMQVARCINVHSADIDCVIKYGSYINPTDHPIDDCITGLIGMRCKFIKQIQFPKEYEPADWNWAKTARTINSYKVHLVKTLGIAICIGSNRYFDV